MSASTATQILVDNLHCKAPYDVCAEAKADIHGLQHISKVTALVVSVAARQVLSGAQIYIHAEPHPILGYFDESMREIHIYYGQLKLLLHELTHLANSVFQCDIYHNFKTLVIVPYLKSWMQVYGMSDYHVITQLTLTESQKYEFQTEPELFTYINSASCNGQCLYDIGGAILMITQNLYAYNLAYNITDLLQEEVYTELGELFLGNLEYFAPPREEAYTYCDEFIARMITLDAKYPGALGKHFPEGEAWIEAHYMPALQATL